MRSRWRLRSWGCAVDEVLAVLAALARLVPAFATWLEEVTSGRTDTVSLRVRDILPEKSRSAEAVVKLGWR